jgi:phosphoesterase RecJ-like protein
VEKLRQLLSPGISSADVEDTEGFIDYPRNIAGVEVAIMIKPSAEKETVKISFRSRRLNVSELARLWAAADMLELPAAP